MIERAGVANPLGVSVSGAVRTASAAPTSDDGPADVAELRAENARLRAEVEQLRNQDGVIHLDTRTQRLRIRAIDTPVLKCDHLDAHMAGGREIIDKLLTPNTLAGNVDLNVLQRFPLTVHRACFRVPQEAASMFAKTVAGPQLASEGVRIDRISFMNGNRIQVEGTVKKFITLSFAVSAQVSCAGDHAVCIELDKAKIAGVIPVTGLITSLVEGMSTDKRNRANIRVDGNRITIDASSFIPPNLRARLTHFGTENGHLVVKAESPEADAARK